MKEYLFDVKLSASLRVMANSATEARVMMKAEIDGNEANLGAWPNGDPILCQVWTERSAYSVLLEIDGEAL